MKDYFKTKKDKEYNSKDSFKPINNITSTITKETNTSSFFITFKSSISTSLKITFFLMS
jgi:hypothetical protein